MSKLAGLVKIKILGLYSRCANFITFKRNKIAFGNNTLIFGKVKYFGPEGRVTIGTDCILRSGLTTNPLGGVIS